MDEQDVRQEIGRMRKGRIWTGLLLLLIGGVLLLDQMHFPLPDWLFNWHILLLALGLFLGLRHNFRGGAWLVLLIVGGFFLVQDIYPDTHIQRFIWPVALIAVGLVVMLRPGRPGGRSRWGQEWREEYERRHKHWDRHWDKHWDRRWDRHWSNPPGPGQPGADQPQQPGADQPGANQPGADQLRAGARIFSGNQGTYSTDDFIDATSFFGGVHKKVMSKNFKGGDITTIMGGTELDFSQADFTGTVRLDVTQIMGGTKIIVPPHWEVRSEVTALFAGFEDKRQQPAVINSEKVLIIDGTSIFGGIELRNY